MRIGFIDCSNNSVEVFDEVSQIAEEKIADLQLVHVSAPDFSKVPVCSKMLFAEGAQSVIAFATATGQDSELLRLVHEKVIDVEVEASKFIFLVVVFEDEARGPKAVTELAIRRIGDSIENLLSMTSPNEGAAEKKVEPEGGNDELFSTPQYLTGKSEDDDAPPQPPEQETGSSRKLF
jgi:riboflavin synthase